MKFILPLLSVSLILAACSPAQQVTVTSEVTVTSTSVPTETPLPTLTPTPVAVDGIAEDAEGNKLAYLNGEWFVVPALAAEYAKLMVNSDKLVAVGADGEAEYEYDTASGEWVELAKEPLPDGLDWESIEASRLPIPRDYYLNGVITTVGMGRDRSIQSLIQTMNLHGGWRSDNGQNSTEALPAFTQYMFYYVWKERQIQLNTGWGGADLGTWLIWVAQAQESGLAEDWARVSVDIWVNDATTPHQLEKIRVAPFFRQGGQLPDGVRAVREVDYVVVDQNAQDLTMLGEGYTAGLDLGLRPDGRLVFKISPGISNIEAFSASDVVAMISLIPKFMLSRQLGTTVSETGMNYLALNKGNDRYSSFMQIEPATPVEKIYNR